ncbi:hypothetical protein M0R45_035725 [Rubus argutus]|uniref:Uncharacterized protein n=1 Tax=Rubus argutus TaxID=59490 RepID=A0AAW1VWV7_RUBAR
MEPVEVATQEDEANNILKKRDAGALFVLKSREHHAHLGQPQLRFRDMASRPGIFWVSMCTCDCLKLSF